MELQNCTWKWKFQCPKRWESLSKTADPRVRSCDACLKNVYLCNDDVEVKLRALNGECVALKPPKSNHPELPGHLMGAVMNVLE